MVSMIPNFFEVGNIGAVACYTNAQELNVNSLVDYCGSDSIAVPELEYLFDKFNIDYPNLPQYLKDKIDTIDVY